MGSLPATAALNAIYRYMRQRQAQVASAASSRGVVWSALRSAVAEQLPLAVAG
jgi:hypothetical protein